MRLTQCLFSSCDERISLSFLSSHIPICLYLKKKKKKLYSWQWIWLENHTEIREIQSRITASQFISVHKSMLIVLSFWNLLFWRACQFICFYSHLNSVTISFDWLLVIRAFLFVVSQRHRRSTEMRMNLLRARNGRSSQCIHVSPYDVGVINVEIVAVRNIS